jgi:hypothetical protein
MRRERWWVRLTIGLFALVAGLFSGSGPAILDYIVNRETPNFSGKWTGEFKEWCVKGDEQCRDSSQWVKSLETVTISQWGSRVSGTAETRDANLGGHLKFSGRYRISVLAVTYVGQPGAPGAGACVLTSGREQEPLLGYWTGYDRDLKMLMTCPVLS